MQPGLNVGDGGSLRFRVLPGDVTHLGGGAGGSGLAEAAMVLATPRLVLWLELAAREVLRPFLDPDEASVGARVEVDHLAATPLGAEVVAEARLVEIDGRQFNFDVTAHDGVDTIGRGRHRRAVIRVSRFKERLAEKASKMAELPYPTGSSLPPNSGALPPLSTLRVQTQGAVVAVTLHRPAKRNAVNQQMTSEWEAVNAWLAGHPELRVVIVTGAGESFCAGDDIPEVGTLDAAQARALSYRQALLYLAWERLPQVFIAAVNGPAMGAGCVAACACDFRYAASSAQFGMPEVLLGWPPGYGIAQLTALVGKGRALEMCVTGKPVSAQQARDMGLAHDVVPLARLLPLAQERAAALLALPAEALRRTKQLIHADESPHARLAYLQDTDAYVAALALPDAQEGIAAFREKRPAKFTGR